MSTDMKERLWRVDMDTTVYVVAESEGQAMDVAWNAVTEGLVAEYEVNFGAGMVARRDWVPTEWRDAYPFGGDSTSTVQEILEAQAVTDAELESAGQLSVLEKGAEG